MAPPGPPSFQPILAILLSSSLLLPATPSPHPSPSPRQARADIGDFVFENGLLVRVTTTEAARAAEEDITAVTNVDEELIVFPEDNDFVATTEQTVEDGVLEEVFLGTTETRVEAETVTSPSVDEAKKNYEIKEEEGEDTNEQDASANNTLLDTARRPEVNLTSYHNFSSLVSLLENLDSNYSGIASRYVLGRSVEGRDILGLRLAAGVGEQERPLLRPLVKVVGNIHGDESLGREIIIALAQYLAYNYGVEERVTRILDTTEVPLIFTSLYPIAMTKQSPNLCVLDMQNNLKLLKINILLKYQYFVRPLTRCTWCPPSTPTASTG